MCSSAAMKAPYEEPAPTFVPYAETPAMNAPMQSSQMPPVAMRRAPGFATAL